MPSVKKDSSVTNIIYKYGLLVLFGLHLAAVLPFDSPHSYWCYGSCPQQSIMDSLIDVIKSIEFYYPFLRLTTIAISGLYLYLLRKNITDIKYVGLVIAVILFNPLIVPEIERGIWVVFNLMFSIYCLYLYNYLKDKSIHAGE